MNEELEHAVLRPVHVDAAAPEQPARRRWLTAFATAVLCVGLGSCAGTPPEPDRATAAPKNVVIMFADGAALTQWNFGQYTSRVLRGEPFAITDIVLREGVNGMLATQPHGAYVTDSAAAASAMSTGHKVKNGAISIAPDGRLLPTLMQKAKAAGKRVGLVTTATVYDATPAAFGVNATSRRDYSSIVDAYARLEPDVLMGGGEDFFLPAGTAAGKRKDGKDVTAAFRAKGYSHVRTVGELKAVDAPRILGLFAAADLSFELDRPRDKEPTTAEMTAAALKALSKSNPNGFVLLVENENTDTAQHANDAASLMHALWAFDDAVKVALAYQKQHPDTLVIVTGDHETGGFSATYALKDLSNLSSRNRFYADDESLGRLARVTMSFRAATARLGRNPTADVLADIVATGFPGFTLDADLQSLILTRRTSERNFAYLPQNALGMMIARQTGFYWGTSGHTAEPVVVGALGPGARSFHGYQDNTDFAKHLHRLIEGR
jgi:alkaline phosphatase